MNATCIKNNGTLDIVGLYSEHEESVSSHLTVGKSYLIEELFHDGTITIRGDKNKLVSVDGDYLTLG